MFAEVATSFGTVKLLDDLLIIDNEISSSSDLIDDTTSQYKPLYIAYRR